MWIMKQLDLFAGISGISLAAEWAGIETVAFCEKEPFAQGVLRRRFPGRPIYDDVFNLTRKVLEHDGVISRERCIDIVAGGFPCQPFSHAGKRGGTADDRYLWPEMLRIIGEVRPTWVFAENVDGLVSMAQSDWKLVMEDETTICEEAEMVLETIRKDLEDIGYRAIPIVIPACGVGASHRRYRILIVGNTERSGCQGDQRRRTNEESSYGYCEEQNRVMADATGERCSEAREHSGRSKERSSGCSSETLADAKSWRRGSRRPEQSGQPRESSIIGGGSPLAYPRSAGREERDPSAVPSKSGYDTRSSNPIRAIRTAQSGMGGSPYEFSDWLDGWGMNPLDALINFISSYPQPALMGQAQHAWEPPRVATGVKNRAARLKALGNAVDPLQALPVLYGIRVIHEWLQGGQVP
ncbi:C-5 cytosine-specific DNA methylase [Brevibacillus agri BAB-2500]|nr:C-5 cytosine-specific DNA methylase [Brevibacillus agri BAB-2500]